MSEALRQLLMVMVVVIGGMKTAMAQASSSSPGVLLQAGIEKEDVDGDLKTAMTIYEKIATDASAPREVRAKALLRLAGCDEKLGKQARQVYEQIVRDYADQPAAAQARNRLAAIRLQEHPPLPETMSVRKIDREKLGDFGPGDTDGHRVTYIGSDHNLYIGNISGVAKSLVYGHADPDFRKHPQWVASKDFSMIALFLSKTKTRQNTLAVVRVDGTGYRELLHSELEKDEISVSWSWDDASLLVYDFTSKATCPQLWLVSVADGKRRELVHEDSTKCIMRAALSPDGQFAAYEVWPIQVVQPTTSKVFVVPTKGGEPRLIYECPWQDPRIPLLTFADWTADGRYLAVKGIHEGRQALFLQPVKSGLAAGAPIFVRVGDFEEASSTLSGALVFEDRSSLSSSSSWHVAAIDPDGNIGKWSPIDFSGRLPSHPSFSPDASQIAYIDRSLNSTHFDLMIRDVATGRERIVYQGTSESSSCRYSSIHPIVFCTISKGDGATDLFSVSVDSGAVERIATFSEARYLLQPPQDDKVFYFVKSWDIYADPKIRWDRITQQEAIVVDAAEDDSHMYTLCLDGRWVLRQFNGNLAFRPASGGNWKTLASGIEDFGRPGSTPNGNWALYVTSDSQGNPGIFEAPFSGGEPRRVGDLPSGYRYGYAYIYFVFSPDARKILVIDTYPKSDMWLLENFEPKTPK